MEKQINDKIKDLNNSAGSQEELMKALAQIDEEGQLTDDVLDAVSGGALSGVKLGTGDQPMTGVWISPIGGDQTA